MPWPPPVDPRLDTLWGRGTPAQLTPQQVAQFYAEPPVQLPPISWRAPYQGSPYSGMPTPTPAGELAQIAGREYNVGGASANALGELGGEAATTAEGGMLKSLMARAGQAGFTSPLEGGLRGVAGRAGQGLGYAIGGQVAAGLNNAVGGPSELSGALKGAGTGAAIGGMFGAPGAFTGAIVGGAAGALQGPLGDLHAANAYDKMVDQYLVARKTLPKGSGLRAEAKKAALAIHNNAAIPLTQKPAAMAALVQQMQAAAANPQAAKSASGKLTKSDLKIQLEMQQTMAALAQQAIGSGDAMAGSIRAGIPGADPRMAALMEADAAQRAAFGRQAAGAYTAATAAQPQIAKMDSQLALLRQLQQQIAAQQSASGGGASISSLLAAQPATPTLG